MVSSATICTDVVIKATEEIEITEIVSIAQVPKVAMVEIEQQNYGMVVKVLKVAETVVDDYVNVVNFIVKMASVNFKDYSIDKEDF